MNKPGKFDHLRPQRQSPLEKLSQLTSVEHPFISALFDLQVKLYSEYEAVEKSCRNSNPPNEQELEELLTAFSYLCAATRITQESLQQEGQTLASSSLFDFIDSLYKKTTEYFRKVVTHPQIESAPEEKKKIVAIQGQLVESYTHYLLKAGKLDLAQQHGGQASFWGTVEVGTLKRIALALYETGKFREAELFIEQTELYSNEERKVLSKENHQFIEAQRVFFVQEENIEELKKLYDTATKLLIENDNGIAHPLYLFLKKTVTKIAVDVAVLAIRIQGDYGLALSWLQRCTFDITEYKYSQVIAEESIPVIGELLRIYSEKQGDQKYQEVAQKMIRNVFLEAHETTGQDSEVVTPDSEHDFGFDDEESPIGIIARAQDASETQDHDVESDELSTDSALQLLLWKLLPVLQENRSIVDPEIFDTLLTTVQVLIKKSSKSEHLFTYNFWLGIIQELLQSSTAEKHNLVKVRDLYQSTRRELLGQPGGYDLTYFDKAYLRLLCEYKHELLSRLQEKEFLLPELTQLFNTAYYALHFENGGRFDAEFSFVTHPEILALRLDFDRGSFEGAYEEVLEIDQLFYDFNYFKSKKRSEIEQSRLPSQAFLRQLMVRCISEKNGELLKKVIARIDAKSAVLMF